MVQHVQLHHIGHRVIRLVILHAHRALVSVAQILYGIRAQKLAFAFPLFNQGVRKTFTQENVLLC